MSERYSKTVFVIQLGLSVLYFLFKLNGFLWAAVILGLVAITIPRASQAIDWFWGRLASVLGWINARILLTVVFFLVLTPIAMFSRLFRKDPLGLKRPKDSNWVERRHSVSKEDLKYPF